MALTGAADGPPTAATGFAATAVRRALAHLGGPDTSAQLPDLTVLSQRAAALGLWRAAPRSCGGATRLLRCSDGWMALSLARESDRDLVPALVSITSSTTPTEGGAWRLVEDWCSSAAAEEAVARARLLGLPAVRVPDPPIGPPQRPWHVSREGGRRNRAPGLTGAKVLDLTSLWAGPLCTHLLTRLGADVLVVESRRRPDGSRATPRFRSPLRAGQAHLWLELDRPEGVTTLRALIAAADLVVSASRPRAITHLGISTDEVVAAGTSWLSISAYGWDGDGQHWVGFGDDIAAGSGLLAARPPASRPWLGGDAIADPVAGVHAAVLAAHALERPEASFMDLSMHHLCRSVAGLTPPPHSVEQRSGDWWVDDGHGRPVRVHEPGAVG